MGIIKSKILKEKGQLEKMAFASKCMKLKKWFNIVVVYGESWSEMASWLGCCLHRLLTIVSLAADLVHQDCIISGRMAKVHSVSTKTVWSMWGLFSFLRWHSSSCQSSSQYYWSWLVLNFFHWIGCLLDSCLPAASGSPVWCNFFWNLFGIVLKTFFVCLLWE